MIKSLRRLTRRVKSNQHHLAMATERSSPSEPPTKSDPYTADAPIRTPDQDLFRRWPFAQRVAQTIANRIDPSSIVIGIYGAWGEGKTSVLNFIETELRQSPRVVCFRFNPWRFPDEERLIVNFLAELAEVLGKSLSTNKEKIGEIFGKYLIAPASIIGQAETARQFSFLLSSIELEKLRSRIENLLRQEAKRVVVLMDDIDRLDKNEIHSLFRLIKLSVDFNYTAYVLSFDDEMVASALQDKYSSKDADAGRNFLEKIIQVPLRLPPAPSAALTKFCFSSVDQALSEAGIEITEQDAQTYARLFSDGLEIRLRTPRMAKRYGNVLAFCLPMMKHEVNTVEYMLIEGIRIFYPELYNTIKNHPDVFLGQELGSGATEQVKKGSIEIIERGLTGLRPEERDAAKILLMVLFPRLKGIFGNTSYGSDWNMRWAREQRIASPAYFSRYFSYSIPEGDISDRDIATYVENLDRLDTTTVTQRLVQLIDNQNAKSAVEKLLSKSSSISGDNARKLAKAISLNGDRFPTDRSPFSFGGTFSQAAKLVVLLADNISDSIERMNFVKETLLGASPITFAIEIFQWSRAKREDKTRVLTPEQVQELGKVIATRIRDLADGGNDFLGHFPNDVPLLLGVWASWGGRAETNDYVQNLIKSDKTKTTGILKCYVPTSWGMENGLSSKGDFERDQYDSLVRVVEPSVIYSSLKEIYGNALKTSEFPFREGFSDETVAKQFAWLYENANKISNKQDHPKGVED